MFLRLVGEEQHADAIGALFGKLESKRAAFADKELMRHLQQQAGAVTCFRIAAACAAMGEVDENLESLLNDVVGLAALDVSYKADAASIMLVLGVVETLFRW